MKRLAAIILAAGQSKRMGQPKMVLPWGANTVLGQVIEVYGTALKTDGGTDFETEKRIERANRGTDFETEKRRERANGGTDFETEKRIEKADWEAEKRIPETEIIIVTGGAREIVEAEAMRWAGKFAVRCVHNPGYESSGMLESLQCGLAELKAEVEATLIGPGDQPQLSLSAARAVVAAFERSGARIVVPSQALRRGHPWLVRRDFWPELLALRPPQTLRDFLTAHAAEILYVETDQTVLKDLDTPEDYRREKP